MVAVLAAFVALPLAAPLAAAAAPPGPVFADGQAQPVFDPNDVVRQDVFVRVPVDSDADGKPDEIHVQLTRPRATEQGLKVPSVYQISPYFAGGNEVANHNVDVELHVPGPNAGPISSRYDAYFLARGFAMVYAESLGSGQSTGCPTTGGRNETAGGKAVVDWLNGRATARDAAGRPVTASWSTGKVGMIGTSYNGTLPNAVASTGVQGLEAIVPIAAISSWYDYYRDSGAVVAAGGYQGEDADVLARYVYTRADREICKPVMAKLEREQDRITGDYNEFWDERNYLNEVGSVHAAVLEAHGLNDWNVKLKQAAQWYAALREHGVPHKLWLHQSAHTDPISLRKDEWLKALNRWFTRYVYGQRNNVEAEPRLTIQREDLSWTDEAEWPNPAAADAVLRPSAGGRTQGGLAAQRSGHAVEQLTDDATKTAEQLTDAASSVNRLSYATAATSKPLRVSGTPGLRVKVAFDKPAANLTALLVDRGPDGKNKIITRGWTDPQNRDSLWDSQPVRPGESYSLQIRLQPKDYVLPAGHRFGLVLLSSDHDFTLRPKPGTGLSVDLAGTALTLPLVGGAAALQSATSPAR
ncbi:Xaa-Pro dipeptidyl-peptidase [Kutzneria viridogrisea]